jgi:Flp pilus assembly pilin Flp
VAALLCKLHLSLLGFREERGQTSAEYALVLLGAASIALLIALWAKDTDRIGKLLDTVMDSIIKLGK